MVALLEDLFVWPGEGENPHTRNKVHRDSATNE